MCVLSQGVEGPRPLRVTALLTMNPEEEGAHTGIQKTQVESLQSEVRPLVLFLLSGTAIAVPFAQNPANYVAGFWVQ